VGWLLHLIVPAPCLACGRPLAVRVAPLGLCEGCRGRLRPVGRVPGPDLLAVWAYEPPLDAVILALKFRRLEYLGGHLAEAAAARLGSQLDGVEVAVAVPIHWRRRLARGYNQAEAMARPLARRLGIPFAAALSRPRPAPPQTRLGRRARLANLRGAFRVRRPRAVAGRRVLLVDDVATTGATLAEAARALRDAGAAAVVAVVAGYTAEPLVK
jgi:ComF family protein